MSPARRLRHLLYCRESRGTPYRAGPPARAAAAPTQLGRRIARPEVRSARYPLAAFDLPPSASPMLSPCRVSTEQSLLLRRDSGVFFRIVRGGRAGNLS